MNDKVISLRLNKDLYRKMKMHEQINWSSIVRKTISQELDKMEENNFDEEKAKKAARDSEKIRKSGIFDGGETGTEIIRKWREKRKF